MSEDEGERSLDAVEVKRQRNRLALDEQLETLATIRDQRGYFAHLGGRLYMR